MAPPGGWMPGVWLSRAAGPDGGPRGPFALGSGVVVGDEGGG
jgi:hypothetical protein